MPGLTQDLRYVTRALVKRPGRFSVAAVVTLALGIGANAAIFSVLDLVLFRALPYGNPDRLVAVTDIYEGQANGVGQDEFREWAQNATSFEGFALTELDDAVIPGDGDSDAERILGSRVTAGFFRVLGVEPLHGRAFLPDEDLPGRAAVVVLSHALWQRRFGGSPDVIGKTIRLDEGSATVIGVMPASFFWVGFRSAEFWRPLGYVSSGRSQHQYSAVGRLEPGVSLAVAQSQMTALAHRAEEQHPEAKGWSVRVAPLGHTEAQTVRAPLLLLATAGGLVLLIACANLAGLMLVRTTARSREMAIRAAMGASRARLVRQLLVESGFLTFFGAAVGLVLAHLLLGAVATLIPPGMGFPATLGIDARVLAFSLILSIATTFLFGLAAARRAWSLDLLQCMKAAGAPGPPRRFLRNIVVLEVALASVLLVAAGLLLTNLSQLLGQELGFRSEHVLTTEVRLPQTRYAEAQRVAFFRQYLERIGTLPGVQSVAATNSLPMSGYYSSGGFEIEGRPPPNEWRQQSAQQVVITPGYFRTMEIPPTRGRDLTAADREGAPRVVIISDGMARRYWPNGDPVGHRIRSRYGTEWLTIVGVASDTRYGGPKGEPGSTMYVPHAQTPISQMFVVARLTTGPGSVVPGIRRSLRQMDASVPLTRVALMDELIARALIAERLLTALLGGFAMLTLALAAVGIYGVVAQSVAQRTHEIGVRVALGATHQQVLRGAMRGAMVLTGKGAALGALVAAAVAHGLAALLYGVRPMDPVVFTGVPLLLGAVALLASYVPARRAISINPVDALRSE